MGFGIRKKAQFIFAYAEELRFVLFTAPATLKHPLGESSIAFWLISRSQLQTNFQSIDYRELEEIDARLSIVHLAKASIKSTKVLSSNVKNNVPLPSSSSVMAKKKMSIEKHVMMPKAPVIEVLDDTGTKDHA